MRHLIPGAWILLLALPASAQISNSDTDFLYARKLYEDKLYPLAAQEFSRFVRNYPSDARIPDARFYAGMSYYSTQLYDNARREFQFLAIDHPKDKRAPDAWLKVAECHAALNDFAAAANALSSISTFYPDATIANSSVLLASEYFLKAGDSRSAKDKLQKFIADRPNIPEVHVARLKLAQIFIREDNFNQALIELLSVTEKAKDPELIATAIFERSRLMESRGKSDEARQGYERIAERYSKTKMNRYALYEIGLILAREKNFEGARTSFESVVRLSSASDSLKQRATIEIGDSYFASALYNKAGEAYRAAVQEGPDSAGIVEARFKIALTHEAVNNLKIANDELSKIAESGSGSPSYVSLAYLKLAQNFQKLKRHREAVAAYDHFIRVFPRHAKGDRALLQRGTILLEDVKDYQETILTFQDLLKNHPASLWKDRTELLLARAYRENGQLPEALAILRQFRLSYPGSDWIDEAEAELEFIHLYYPETGSQTLQNMVHLMGSLIEDRPKDQVTFAYARLFFDQIKDYSKAAGIFQRVAASTEDRVLRDDAWYYAALCYDRLAQKFPTEQTWTDSAIQQYRLLTGGRYADVAALRIVHRTLRDVSDEGERAIKAKAYFTGLLERYPTSASRDEMLFELGQAMMQLREYRSAAKSSSQKGKDSIPSFPDALSCYEEIIRQHSSSRYADGAYFFRALCLYLSGDKSAFASALQQYLGAFPRGKFVARAKFMNGRYFEDKGEYKTAVASYEELIAHYSYSQYADSASQGIGNTYLLARNWERAIAAYERGLRLRLGDFSDVDVVAGQRMLHNPVDYKIAFSYQQMSNLSRAIEYYENYLFPDRKGEFAAEALMALGTMYEQKFDRKNAVRYYGYLNEVYPETDLATKGLIRIAEIHFESGKYKEARTAFETLAARSKDVSQQLIFDSRVVVCAYRLGLIQQTTPLEKAFDKKYEKEKAVRVLYMNALGEMQFELGRYYQYEKLKYDLAFKTYQKLVEDYKNNGVAAEALFEMAVIRFKEGKSKEGFDLLQEIPRKYPDSEMIPRVYLRLALEAFQLEQVQTAIEASKTALQHPKIARTDARIGTDFLIKVYKTAGYYENALLLVQDYLEKYSDSDPADIFSKRIDIGVMHKNLKAYDRAIEYFKDLIKVASGEDEAEIQFHIGETYFAMGNFEQALLEYLRIPYLALGVKFDWATAAKGQAAECYARLNKLPEAIQMYEEIIKKHGANSEYGRFARQRITELQKLSKSQ